MTGITQQIPNYIHGISDQPDELKRPGHVRDLVNAYPDVTRGLSKRPGFQYVSEVKAGPTGTWLNIIRESVEGTTQRYVAHIGENSSVKIWNADTGAEVPVYWNDGAPLKLDDIPNLNKREYPLYQTDYNYLRHTSSLSEIKTLTINDFTFLANSEEIVTMSKNKKRTRYDAFIELTTLAYNRSYDLDVDFLDIGGNTTYTVATKIRMIETDKVDDDRGEGCRQIGTYTTTFEKSDERFVNSVADSRANGLRVEIRTLGDIVQVDNDGNPDDYRCRYTHFETLLNGGSYWTVGDIVKFRPDGDFDGAGPITYVYEVTETQKVTTSTETPIRGVNTPNTADAAISAESVLSQIKDKLEAEGFAVQVIGNGLYLKHDDPFVVTTPEIDLFNILSQDDADERIIVVNDVSRLPIQCKKGLIVKVANSFNDSDDYYVQFISQEGVTTSGDGYWEEIAQPGGYVELNPSTMPHALVKSIKSNNGVKEDVFLVTNIDWNDRTCGTDDFNPSFNNRQINNMFLYRSRMSFLSGENVIMSRPNDLFNFFPKTALTVSPVDPIDLKAATKSASVLRDSIVINSGVILFSEFNQFLLATDSDSLRPETAKINQLSTYDYLKTSKPFNIGTNIGFVGSSSKSTRLYEMTNTFREGQVDIKERSKIVQKTLISGLDRIADSKENGVLMLGKTGVRKLYCYKYFKEDSQTDIQSSWFTWRLPHGLVHHFLDQSTYYSIVYDEEAQTSYLLNCNVFDYDVDSDYTGVNYESATYLDYWQVVDPANITQNKSTVDIEYRGPVREEQLFIITSDGDYYPESRRNGTTFTFPCRDIDTSSVKIGYPFNFTVKFPTIYPSTINGKQVRSDTRSHLTIHRLNFSLGAVGMYEFELRRLGADKYRMEFEVPIPDGYPADGNPVITDYMATVPVYNKNSNIEIKLVSDHPTPAIIQSMNWEGDYNSKFYKRV